MPEMGAVVITIIIIITSQDSCPLLWVSVSGFSKEVPTRLIQLELLRCPLVRVWFVTLYLVAHYILTTYLISWKVIQCENCKKKGSSVKTLSAALSVDRTLMVGLARWRPHYLLVQPQHKETFGTQEEILALRAPDVFNLGTDHLLLTFWLCEVVPQIEDSWAELFSIRSRFVQIPSNGSSCVSASGCCGTADQNEGHKINL